MAAADGQVWDFTSGWLKNEFESISESIKSVSISYMLYTSREEALFTSLNSNITSDRRKMLPYRRLY